MDTPYLGTATCTLRAIDVWPCINWQTDKNVWQKKIVNIIFIRREDQLCPLAITKEICVFSLERKHHSLLELE